MCAQNRHLNFNSTHATDCPWPLSNQVSKNGINIKPPLLRYVAPLPLNLILTRLESLNLPRRFRHRVPYLKWRGANPGTEFLEFLSNGPFFPIFFCQNLNNQFVELKKITQSISDSSANWPVADYWQRLNTEGVFSILRVTLFWFWFTYRNNILSIHATLTKIWKETKRRSPFWVSHIWYPQISDQIFLLQLTFD